MQYTENSIILKCALLSTKTGDTCLYHARHCVWSNALGHFTRCPWK